ncbi:D-alanyl-D-alanine carboxypeptidase family protein [Fulvimarina endophytica]|uniref:D-alanyl-D-alanine carboxypeptidase family protein n=1 Tax=Fulvimarina endophytica TaxID=2293836 RepID=UPI001FE00F0C|nr:D-alanyl-D-alanine carboxypeptidase family protein [Fulvimarina endophytica]
MRSALLAALLAALPLPALATPALVVDADSRAVLLAEDAGDPWYPASTTKLMSAYVTFRAIAAGEVDLETPVVVTKRAMGEASLHAGLSAGRAMTLRDALYAMLVGSANEVAISLAQTVGGSVEGFVDRMNAAAAELGMNATRFANPNGLFAPEQHVTARDLALLGLAVTRDFPEYLPIFETSEVVVDGKRLESENTLLTGYEGTLGLKTGFLCASGRNIVALAERGGRSILVVLLGATTGRERAERTAMLMTEAFEGRLQPTGLSLEAIPDRPEVPPQDMRVRLCTDAAAAYETERNRLYPMGLAGQPSYLDAAIAPRSHAITTWLQPVTVKVPVPRPRPAGPQG